MKKNKLALHRQTITSLSPGRLRGAAGGRLIEYNQPTYSCDTSLIITATNSCPHTGGCSGDGGGGGGSAACTGSESVSV
jgi:hypothetical protein